MPPPPQISEADAEQYRYEFEERVAIKVEAGMTELCPSREINPGCCARHDALLDLGCLEFWALSHAGREGES